jgi:uncharacterized protein YyaL (SSP411 family)
MINNITLFPINLTHLKEMTDEFGVIQFAKTVEPDIHSGYTLDDNSRALIAMCQHYEQTKDKNNLHYIETYFNFIKYCLQPEGYFLNYVNRQRAFTDQNRTTNLADANGRAIWALGYAISKSDLLPKKLTTDINSIMRLALHRINTIHSTRAMGFLVKGLYYSNIKWKSRETTLCIIALANKLVQMYRHESEKGWEWFENYFTYANSVLPEALLCAYLETNEEEFKNISKESFDFLLSQIFSDDCIKIISNKGWMQKGEETTHYGEQPADIAYTIMALSKFYDAFGEDTYLHKMEIAFSWFTGNNHLHKALYDPGTGGCYDGVEEKQINPNQGSESTISYLLARSTIGRYFEPNQEIKFEMEENSKINE